MSEPTCRAAACRRAGSASTDSPATRVGPTRALRIGWVIGWAVPEPWFASLARAALPNAHHSFFPAASDTVESISAAAPFDWLVGYSLGAQLLLSAAAANPTVERAVPGALAGSALAAGSFFASESASVTPRSTVATSPRVALLAPIFAFLSEDNFGGRVARTQVKFLARWLRRDRAGALADFYARAGLDISPVLAAELSPEALTWGLAQLESTVLPPALPPGWRAWCGADDELLDAARLRALTPEISVVPSATHHPAALLRAFAQEVTA